MSVIIVRETIAMAVSKQPAIDEFFKNKDWIHCNLCIKGVQANVQFFALTCSHIFCKTCIQKSKAPNSTSEVNCPVCKKTTKFKQISPSLDANIRRNFEPIDGIWKTALCVANYQREQRSGNIKRQAKKNQRIKDETHKLRTKIVAMKKERQRVEAINKELSKELLKDMTQEQLSMFLNCSSADEVKRNVLQMFGPIGRNPPQRAAIAIAPAPAPTNQYGMVSQNMQQNKQVYKSNNQSGMGSQFTMFNSDRSCPPRNAPRRVPAIPPPYEQVPIVPRRVLHISPNSPVPLLQQLHHRNLISRSGSTSSASNSSFNSPQNIYVPQLVQKQTHSANQQRPEASMQQPRMGSTTNGLNRDMRTKLTFNRSASNTNSFLK